MVMQTAQIRCLSKYIVVSSPSSFGDQIPQGEIVNHVFDFLNLQSPPPLAQTVAEHTGCLAYRVLDAIAAFSQYVILQIEQLKPGEEILDKRVDFQRTRIVSQCDRVDRQTGEFFDHGDQREQVFFDGEVERVFVFEIDWDWWIQKTSY